MDNFFLDNNEFFFKNIMFKQIILVIINNIEYFIIYNNTQKIFRTLYTFSRISFKDFFIFSNLQLK